MISTVRSTTPYHVTTSTRYVRYQGILRRGDGGKLSPILAGEIFHFGEFIIIIIIIIIMETYKAPFTRAQRRRTVHG